MRRTKQSVHKQGMLLAIDVGNTSVDYCLFQGERVKIRTRTATGKGWSALAKRIRPYRRQVTACIISSVVPRVIPSLKRSVQEAIGVRPRIIGRDIRVPIVNRYKKPREVGSDRLVNALSGFRSYGGPLLIVDFGTALTFDLVSRRGEYMGGIIMPGPQIWLDCLAQRTALLPRIHFKRGRGEIPALPGRTTRESIRTGALYGYAEICDGLIARMRKSYGKRMRVVACGGQAKVFVSLCKSINCVDSDLTLKGLHITYRHHMNPITVR